MHNLNSQILLFKCFEYEYLDAMLKLLIFVAATSVLFFQLCFKQYQMHRGWKKAFLGWKNPQIPLTRKAFLVHSSNFFPFPSNEFHPPVVQCTLISTGWMKSLKQKCIYENVFSRIRFLYSVLFSLSPIFISLHSVLMGRSNVL